MEVPAGTINQTTGHINEDDAALYRAIGPDQPDPPSTVGRRSDSPRIPFGWVRPPMGGPPGGFPGGRGPPALVPLLLRSVGRSVRRGRWGVCPECQWQKDARTGLYRSPYNRAVLVNDRYKDTQGENR
jgi:hypothetical protein